MKEVKALLFSSMTMGNNSLVLSQPNQLDWNFITPFVTFIVSPFEYYSNVFWKSTKKSNGVNSI